MNTPITESEHQRRWRLILGQESRLCSGGGLGGLSESDVAMDKALQAIYETDRQAGLGSSCPSVNRWLGDIRTYFPTSTVELLQKDALDRLGLKQMLLEPELLRQVAPDVHLVASLLSLNRVIPERTRETARQVVRRVVQDLERRLANPLLQAVRGSLHKASRTSRPRPHEIDWPRTIRKNLKHYLPDRRTIVPERLVGWGRRRNALREIILCVDQSGSMATSVVYASIMGAVLASLKALKTQMIVFDTAVVDLTEELHDPVDLLFGTQLGGGTDIQRALAYCQERITTPSKTVLVLITDLYEGVNDQHCVQRVSELVQAGVQMICLLALNDDGRPCYNHALAAKLSSLGVPSFGCTPDQFPSLMAAALRREDLNLWAAQQGIATTGKG